MTAIGWDDRSGTAVYQPGGGDVFADLYGKFEEELNQWSIICVDPDPTTPGGLPETWLTVGEPLAFTRRDRGGSLYLVERAAGGCAIMFHAQQHLSAYWIGTTLVSLYSNIAAKDDPARARLLRWLQPMVSALFDTDDPDQVVEQTMFALSGVLTVIPSNDR